MKEELFGSKSFPSVSGRCTDGRDIQASIAVESSSPYRTFCNRRSSRAILSVARFDRKDERKRVLPHSASSSVRLVVFSVVLQLILRPCRYNALRKFAYAPSLPVKPVRSLNEHKFTPGVLAHVHPIAALALGDATLPSDLALEPVDCLSLFKSMQAADPDRLDPSLVPATYFAKTPALKIADVLPYEAALKDVLLNWMEEERGPGTAFHKVVDALEAPLRSAVASSDQAIISGGSDFFHSLFTPMLADLHAKNLLPAIIFK